MIGFVASVLLVSGQAASEVPSETKCAHIYFVGFSVSQASVVSGETRWEGWLNDYDPSTDISAGFRICPIGNTVTFSTVAGAVTVPVPRSMSDVHIVVDSRNVQAARARNEAPLLD